MMDLITVKGHPVTVYSYDTVVMGSGAAGLCAAKRLHDLGERSLVLLTNGLGMGTSRNTGSDKQTYYKLNLSGREPDSVFEVAKTLFDGGAADGDIALVEAAQSARCFYHLADLGVPFVRNEYGEFVGYKTDHDPKARATSAGPLTVQEMCTALFRSVSEKGIPIAEGITPLKVIKDREGKACGLFCLKESPDRTEESFVLFRCRDLIMATGAPAALYGKSVFPASQIGASGVCFEAGAKGKNLTEWQYGLASIKFRWNVSGSYQQVLPRYVSTAADGSDEREFLSEWFPDPIELLGAVFLKGYQWPFDAAKLGKNGSSWVDIAVYTETVLKGRRVWLDYTKNPLDRTALDISLLPPVCRDYLEASGAVGATPLERLSVLNPDAIRLYAGHGIDLTKDYLEIDVCAQHNNGGIAANCDYETEVPSLFVVGELCGSHGVRRPGGSALNAGQVGAFRAAEAIALRHRRTSEETPLDLEAQLSDLLTLADSWKEKEDDGTLERKITALSRSNSDHAGFVRSRGKIAALLASVKAQLADLKQLGANGKLGEAFRYRDRLITAVCYLTAILDYIENGGISRGSYLIAETLPAFGTDVPVDSDKLSVIQEILYRDGEASASWRPVRPLPESPQWFEQVWREMKQREEIK